MIPDFPKIKDRFQESINAYYWPLNKKNYKTVFEGCRTQVKNSDRWARETPLKKISTKMELNQDAVYKMGFFVVVESFRDVFSKMEKLNEEMIWDELNEITKLTGKREDANKQKLNPDIFLKIIEKCEFIFDYNNTARTHIIFERLDSRKYISTVIIDRNNNLKLINFDIKHKKIIENALTDNDFKSKLSDLIGEKRKKWYDRESHRKLVD